MRGGMREEDEGSRPVPSVYSGRPMPNLTPERLRELGQTIFQAAGASPANAARVTASLVDANLAGHDSHGVQHIPGYVRSVQEGQIVGDAEPRVLRETPVTALVSGQWTFGQVAAGFAPGCAIEKARRSGLAAVGLVQVNHIGRLGEYAEMAARAGVVAIVVAGGFAEERGQAVPFGGARPALGTNPIAVGFPAGRSEAMFLDFATTAIAAGKVAVARAKGLPLSPGVLLDREGRATTDPNAYYEGGALLPFGGHKGYALSMAVEFLGRVVTGSETFATEGRGGQYFARSGTMVIALDPAASARTSATASAPTRRSTGSRPSRRRPATPRCWSPASPSTARAASDSATASPCRATWESIRECAVSLGLPDPA